MDRLQSSLRAIFSSLERVARPVSDNLWAIEPSSLLRELLGPLAATASEIAALLMTVLNYVGVLCQYLFKISRYNNFGSSFQFVNNIDLRYSYLC